MIFLTVGTYPLPFDRLLIAVDDAIANGVIEEEVFAQVGLSSYRPRNMKYARMLGQKPYEQIPYYGKCFDVAIMPWRQNRWIEACNPIKLKEYLALGKPVVSTPFPELQEYRDVVYEAQTPEEFSGRIRQALVENSPKRITARREKVRNDTWDCKAKFVLDELLRGNGCSWKRTQ